MSIFSNVTEQDLIDLRKLAEQQKNRGAEKIKNRILKQAHDIKLAEISSSITKKIEDVNKSNSESIKETTKQIIIKSDIVHENTQTPAIENITATQSLRDTLAFMKKKNNFFKVTESKNGEVYWISVRIKSLGDNKINNIGKEYDITPVFNNVLPKLDLLQNL